MYTFHLAQVDPAFTRAIEILTNGHAHRCHKRLPNGRRCNKTVNLHSHFAAKRKYERTGWVFCPDHLRKYREVKQSGTPFRTVIAGARN